MASIMMIFTACGEPVQPVSNKPTAIQPVQLEENIDQSEAVNVIENMIHIDYTNYKIDLINMNLICNGNEYYQFLISGSQSSMEPSIIVSKNNGAILYYYPDGTTTELDQNKDRKSVV